MLESADPVAHVLWEVVVKFIETSWHDECIVPDVSPVNNGDWVGHRFSTAIVAKFMH